MKAMLLVALLTASALSAANNSGVLLISPTTELAKDGRATRAVYGETSISADSIQYDRSTGALRCEGNVTIRRPDAVVTAERCTITLREGTAAYTLNAQGVKVTMPPTTVPAASKPAERRP